MNKPPANPRLPHPLKPNASQSLRQTQGRSLLLLILTLSIVLLLFLSTSVHFSYAQDTDPTALEETLNAAVNTQLAHDATSIMAQTLAVNFESTVRARVNALLTQTAESVPTSTATPTLDPTLQQQRLEALVSTRIGQTAQAQQGLTATAMVQAIVNGKIQDLMTATTQARHTSLIAGLSPLTIDNALKISQIDQWKGHTANITGLAFSPDGTALASSSLDTHVIVWDVKSGSAQVILTGFSDRLSVAFSPDGSRVAASSSDGTVRIWDWENNKVLLALKPARLRSSMRTTAFSPDGTLIAAGTEAGSTLVWDANKGSLVATLPGHSQGVGGIVFMSDGTIVVTVGLDGNFEFNEVKTAQTLVKKSGGNQLLSVASNSDGSLFAAGNYNGSIQLWDDSGNPVPRVFSGASGTANSISFSPDGTLLASGGSDSMVRLWNTQTGKLIAQLKGHTGPISAVAFSPDGARLATAGLDGLIHIWGIQSAP